MDPFSGNALIGYSRLNVANGQNIMYEKPWTKNILAKRPWIDGVTMEDGVDYIRGGWDEGKQMLFLTVRTWDGRMVVVKPMARNLVAGTWEVYIAGNLQRVEDVAEKGNLNVEFRVGGESVDVIFVKVA